MKVLAIQSGIFGDNSNSTTLVKSIVSKLQNKYDDVTVTTRDLTVEPLPYFDAQTAMALGSSAEDRNDAQQALVALSDQVIDELKSADIVVLGAPMYNFGIPAQLKSWFDYLGVAGKTFTYTENGAVGLIEDKPVYVVAARGGVHKDQLSDGQTAHLRTMLGFMGLNSVEILYAEGLAMGDEAKAASIAQFDASVDALI